jgi:hypothetical protein
LLGVLLFDSVSCCLSPAVFAFGPQEKTAARATVLVLIHMLTLIMTLITYWTFARVVTVATELTASELPGAYGRIAELSEIMGPCQQSKFYKHVRT